MQSVNQVEHELLVYESLYPKQEDRSDQVCMSGKDVLFASDQQRDGTVPLPVGTTCNILILSWLREGGGGRGRRDRRGRRGRRRGG